MSPGGHAANWLDRMLNRPKRHLKSPTPPHSPLVRPTQSFPPTQGGVGRYFHHLEQLQLAMKVHDYRSAAQWARESIDDLPGLVRGTRASYGRFDIVSIPVLEEGATLLAVYGDREALERMTRVVEGEPALRRDWTACVAAAEEDRILAERTIEHVAMSGDGVLQRTLKAELGITDGRHFSTLVQWLAKAGRVKRAKEGKGFRLSA